MIRPIATLVVAAALAAPASAASLNLSAIQSKPDINVTNVTASYDADTNTFSATSQLVATLQLDLDGLGTTAESTGDLTITAAIDENGNLSSGMLTINEYYVGTGGGILPIPQFATSRTLLTAQAIGFGFETAPGTAFEFLWEIDGGEGAGIFGGLGTQIGTLLTPVGVDLDDTTPFGGTGVTNYGAAGADTFALIPEPTAMALLAPMAVAMVRRRK